MLITLAQFVQLMAHGLQHRVVVVHRPFREISRKP
jgi:hypothetical protein